jgi:hypothetical protein
MPLSDRVQLLGGPYHAPALQRGDRATCLCRDCEVYVTSWTDARIPWPRCKVRGQRGGTGLLVTEELARAVRTESAAALAYSFGVNVATVTAWRKMLGIGQWQTDGSRRLHQASSEAGARKCRGKKLPRSLVESRLEIRRQNGIRMPQRWATTGWKPEDLALLGTIPDEELARQLGRTRSAVRSQRVRQGIPPAISHRGEGSS